MAMIDLREPRRPRVPLVGAAVNPAAAVPAAPPPPAQTNYAQPRTNAATTPVTGADPYRPPASQTDNSGVSGYGQGGATPPPATPPPAIGAYGGQMSGFDPGKLANAEHQTPKYQLARALSAFDPRKGITAEVEAALDALGLGDFQRVDDDEVRLVGGDPRWEGLSQFDLIEGFGTGNGRWTYQGVNPNAPPPQAAAGAGGAGTGSAVAQGAGGGSAAPNGSPLPTGFDAFGPSNPSSLGAFQFDDPDTVRLLEFINERVKGLTSGVEDPTVQRALDTIFARADQLQGPAYSDTETAQIRTQGLDQLEQNRQQEIRAATRRLMQMGHGPESGTIQQAAEEINEKYRQARTTFERDLAVDMIDRTDDRRNQAVSLVTQAPGITRQARGEQQANLDKALSLMSLPVDLTDRRMQAALQVLGLGGGSNPMGIFNSLANLSAQTAAQANQNSVNDSAFWAQLGQLIASAGRDGE